MKASLNSHSQASKIDSKYNTLINNEKFKRDCAREKLDKCDWEEIEELYYEYIL